MDEKIVCVHIEELLVIKCKNHYDSEMVYSTYEKDTKKVFRRIKNMGYEIIEYSIKDVIMHFPKENKIKNMYKYRPYTSFI